MFIGKKLDAPVLPEDRKINNKPLLKQEDLVLKELGSSEKAPKTLTRSAEHVFANYQTTSSQYNAVVGGLPTACKYSGLYFLTSEKVKQDKIRNKFKKYCCRFY